MSRIQNSKRNILNSSIGQALKICMKVMVRTVIIYQLGAIYLGLDGLFLNVISMLSLVELGIGDAICFALYKPIAENDNYTILAYLNFYKVTYNVIGFIIFLLGILIMPMLPYIVSFEGEAPINYYLVYFLFLLNTVASYSFGAYKQTYLMAWQKAYITTKIKNVVFIITSIGQGLILIVSKNYYLYLVIMILGTIITNVWSALKANKYIPLSKYDDKPKLNKSEKTSLIKNVYALSLNKISTTIYTSSDNIVISMFLGTIVVGYYSNYSYIVSAISGFISIAFSAVTASIGNANIECDKQYMTELFENMLFVNKWIYGFCFICFWSLLSPFIQIWLGKEFLLNENTVFLIALMFLLCGLNHTCTVFRAAAGLFWQTRYRTLATAIINVVLSVILVQFLGLNGVFIGTIIAYFCTTFIVDPPIVYRNMLSIMVDKFYKWYLYSVSEILIVGVIVKYLTDIIPGMGIASFIMRLLLCCFIPNVYWLITNYRKKEFVYFKNLLYSMIRKEDV